MANRPKGTRDGYMPQLDSLRAFAVFGVMVTHFVPAETALRKTAQWGELGVWLFFVLSGFLITGILLMARRAVDGGQTTTRAATVNFYIRRFLRLMPIYYLLLLAAAAALPHSRPHLWAFAAYLQNFLFAARPDIYANTMAHFWTLAVEEQFYLLWPAVVLLTPRRYLISCLVATVITGPSFRAAGLAAGFSAFQVSMMMPAHADTLGLGALLVVLRSESPVAGRRLMNVGCWAGWPMLVLCVGSEHVGASPNLLYVVRETAAGLAFVWLVGRASFGFGGVVGWLLDCRVFVFLGTISYGLYVYHFNVPGLLRDRIFPLLELSWPDSSMSRFALSVAVTVTIASASWWLIERPITGLKGYFPYTRPHS